MTRWAIAADLNRCIGCQTCTSACKHANATPPGVQWRKVLDFEAGAFPDVHRAFLPTGCMHCDDPPCMHVCPSTATGKRDDGIVTIDYDICIGCAYCALACPYQARFRLDGASFAYGGLTGMANEKQREQPERSGVAQKCTFCVERIDAGLAAGLTPGIDPEATPACVSSCIAGALHFGDADDPDSNVAKLLAENQHFRMHEELDTGPGIFYLNGAGNADQPEPELVADPASQASVAPARQTSWDWRAAMNFMAGGAGTGLFFASAQTAFTGPTPLLPGLIALALVATGLFCVWMEIGRPWRFLNVFRNPNTSWMTREALAALPFLACGLTALTFNLPLLGMVAALFGLLFLYCQGQILHAAKGIPAWRPAQIPYLIFATGLTEGAGLFLLLTGGASLGMAAGLLALTALRYLVWRRYKANLFSTGAPTRTVEVLERFEGGFFSAGCLAPAALVVAGFLLPGLQPILFSLAGLVVFTSGWWLKFTLVTKAAYNQGYAINAMPARGGTGAPGIKPGWTAKP